MKHSILFLISLIFVFCDHKQTSKNEFLETGLLDSVIAEPKLIHRLIQDIKSNKIKNIHALLIIKDDKLVLEEYFAEFDRNRLQYSASVTKSFTSALLGIAIDKGYFGGDIQTVLNRRLAELFSEFELTIQKDSAKNELRLRHVLSMTAGFEWDEHSYPYSDSRNDCNRINNSADPMSFLFERKLIQKPGTEFYYNGGLSLSISYLIEKYTKMPVNKFAEEFLFKPLDIHNYQWEAVASGLVDTDGGLHLKPLDQAKFGYLFLKNGYWNNQQIIPEEWVSISTTMHVVNDNMPDYAYHWWGGNYTAADQSFFMFLASGYGGQKIVVIPGLNTVIVITQQVFENQFGDLNFIAIMSDFILPSLIPKSTRPTTFGINKTKLELYRGHYVSDDQTEYMDISVGDSKLISVSNDGQTNIFTPVSENIFTTRIMDLFDIYLKFENDSTGSIVSVQSDFAFTHKHFNKLNK